MEKNTIFVGLDMHKDSITASVLVGMSTTPRTVRYVHNEGGLKRLSKHLLKAAEGRDILACYEAGVCGYAPQRKLLKLGIDTRIIAPSEIPRRSGDRVKTDRRDAENLASLLRGGLLVEVSPPTEEMESARDVCRMRDDFMRDLGRCKRRLNMFLIRRSIRYEEGKKAWTQMHRRWLRRLRFEKHYDQFVFEQYLSAVDAYEEKIRQVDDLLEHIGESPKFKEMLDALRCFRGFNTVNAMIVISEVSSFLRFPTAPQFMSWVGVTPSEYSSGGKVSRSGITKTGNDHVRRSLVEAAWMYARMFKGSKTVQDRRRGKPTWVVTLAEKAEDRLFRKFKKHHIFHNKNKNKAVVAVARELAGFLWQAMVRVERGVMSDQKRHA